MKLPMPAAVVSDDIFIIHIGCTDGMNGICQCAPGYIVDTDGITCKGMLP